MQHTKLIQLYRFGEACSCRVGMGHEGSKKMKKKKQASSAFWVIKMPVSISVNNRQDFLGAHSAKITAVMSDNDRKVARHDQ